MEEEVLSSKQSCETEPGKPAQTSPDGTGSWRPQIEGMSVGCWEGLEKKKMTSYSDNVDHVGNSRVVLRVVL